MAPTPEPEAPPRSMLLRLAGAAGLAAVVAAMLGPPLASPPRDSYPLSTYPMFSSDRGRVSVVATVVGLDLDGGIVRLDPHLVSGSDEVMLAVQTASRAVAAGPERASELCAEVAARVAAAGRPEAAGAVAVQVEEHDAVAYFARGGREPRSVRPVATCEVLPAGQESSESTAGQEPAG